MTTSNELSCESSRAGAASLECAEERAALKLAGSCGSCEFQQEFEVVMTRTIREEFLSAFGDSLQVFPSSFPSSFPLFRVLSRLQ